MAKTTPSKAATVPPWIKYPVKRDHPIIVIINWMIRSKIAELNAERHYMADQQKRMLGADLNSETNKYDLYRTADMVMEDALTYDESVNPVFGGRSYYLDRRCLDAIVLSANTIRRLDEEISGLLRLKLSLFGDVDFHGGRDYVKSILKEFTETSTRLAAKKARERDQAKMQAKRDAKLKARFAHP